MKAIILVGTVGLFTAPAVAGTVKKPRDTKKPAPVAAAVEAPKPSVPETAPAPLSIPELPPDTSSPLVPYPELERERPVALAKPAKPAKSATAKAPVMRMGDDYVLGRRQAAKVTGVDVEHIVPKALTQAQVATVVQSHMAEIQVCWDAIPKHLRADACVADLRLAISETGVVTDVELEGDVPRHAHKCITSAVSKWTFPAAETSSDVEYGLSLRSL